MDNMILPQTQTLMSLEQCAELDTRIRTPFDQDRLKELGFVSFHQAVGTMLIKGEKRKAVVDILHVECETLVQNAAVRLGLKWKTSRPRKKHVVTKHQPRKSKSQYLTDEKNVRPCTRCGKPFVQTVQRLRLCSGCFYGAETDELNTISLKGVY